MSDPERDDPIDEGPIADEAPSSEKAPLAKAPLAKAPSSEAPSSDDGSAVSLTVDDGGATTPSSTATTSSDGVPKAEERLFKPSTTFLVVVTFVNLVADLWSKWWAKSTFEAIQPGDERKKVVVDGFMNFIFAKNRGGAWGLLQNEAEALRRPFFLIVSVAAIVFIVSLYRKLRPDQTALKWGLPLVLGGALGNLVDRIRYGFVVDFIDIAYYLPEWATKIGLTPGENHWPTFNVADISICVGVLLMAVDMFTSRDEEESPKSTPRDEASVADA